MRAFHPQKLCWLLALVLVTLSFLAAPVALRAQQNSSHVLAVSQIDASACPRFTAVLRYTDSRSVFVGNLLASDLTASTSEGTPIAINSTVIKNPNLAVVVVVDYSVRMRQAGLLGRSRFEDMGELVSNLAPRVSAPGNEFSLITFDDASSLVIDRQADFRFVTNEMTNLGGKVAQEAKPAYALADALQLGLQQLAKSSSASNRLLIVYAAGDPATPALASVLQAAGMAENPPAVTFVGLNGDLEANAQSANAQYYPFFAPDLPTLNTMREAIDGRYRELTTNSGYYSIGFDASALQPGSQSITFSAPDASTTASLEMCSVAPQIELVTPKQTSGRSFELGIKQVYAQTPIESVTYSLDNQPIGSASADTGYSLQFNLDDPAFQTRQFTSDRDYELTAIATSGGQSSQPTAPILLRLPAGQNVVLWVLIGVGVLLAVAAIAGVLRFMSHRPHGHRGTTNSQPTSDDTRPPETSTQPPEDTVPPDGTMPPDVPLSTQMFQPMRATVRDRRTGQTYSYLLDNPLQTEYGIGKGSGNSIRIMREDPPGVSRNHAKLIPVAEGWEITDISRHGTWLGPVISDEHKMPQKPLEIEPGDLIWIGREISVELESLASTERTQPPSGDYADSTQPPVGTTQTKLLVHQFRPLRVQVHDRDEEPYSYTLDQQQKEGYIIGTAEDCPIRIRRRAPGVSRQHAQLMPVNNGWQLSNYGQHGETYVGAQATATTRLDDQPVDVAAGSTIWIGKDIKLTLEHLG